MQTSLHGRTLPAILEVCGFSSSLNEISRTMENISFMHFVLLTNEQAHFYRVEKQTFPTYPSPSSSGPPGCFVPDCC